MFHQPNYHPVTTLDIAEIQDKVNEVVARFAAKQVTDPSQLLGEYYGLNKTQIRDIGMNLDIHFGILEDVTEELVKELENMATPQAIALRLYSRLGTKERMRQYNPSQHCGIAQMRSSNYPYNF